MMKFKTIILTVGVILGQEEAAPEEEIAPIENLGSLHDPSKCLENGEFDDDCCASNVTDETADPPVFGG